MSKQNKARSKSFRSADPVNREGVSSRFLANLEKVGASSQVIKAARSEGVTVHRASSGEKAAKHHGR
jgi:hypothetical protein